jgi:hypothetical protein
MAQMVGHLPCECKALGPIPSTGKKSPHLLPFSALNVRGDDRRLSCKGCFQFQDKVGTSRVDCGAVSSPFISNRDLGRPLQHGLMEE